MSRGRPLETLGTVVNPVPMSRVSTEGQLLTRTVPYSRPGGTLFVLKRLSTETILLANGRNFEGFWGGVRSSDGVWEGLEVVSGPQSVSES